MSVHITRCIAALAQPAEILVSRAVKDLAVLDGTGLHVPRGADCYVLANVLHDWEDQRATTILRNCRQAMAGAAGC